MSIEGIIEEIGLDKLETQFPEHLTLLTTEPIPEWWRLCFYRPVGIWEPYTHCYLGLELKEAWENRNGSN